MLSQSNINRINDQIARELRNVDSTLTDDREKAASLDRVAKLQELLNPVPTKTEVEPLPSRKTLIKELALALIEAREETRERHARPVDFIEALFGIRR
jgi:hypothetical protein